MAGQKVGVDVRLDDPLYRQTVLGGLGQVDVGVAARIDHDRTAGALVADQVRALRQAVQVVLREDHGFKFPGGGLHQQFEITVSSRSSWLSVVPQRY